MASAAALAITCSMLASLPVAAVEGVAGPLVENLDRADQLVADPHRRAEDRARDEAGLLVGGLEEAFVLIGVLDDEQAVLGDGAADDALAGRNLKPVDLDRADAGAADQDRPGIVEQEQRAGFGLQQMDDAAQRLANGRIDIERGGKGAGEGSPRN